MLRSAPAWAGGLEALAQTPGGREALTVLLRYIARVSNDLHLSDFRAILELHAPTADSVAMTIAEQLHADGLVDGLAKALRAVLDARGFHATENLQQRIQACTDSDALQLWLTGAATASKLEDVFGES